ncbi:putative hexose transport-related protein [Mollisia scopiformis]|uniref:Putative hexose transport-related protein n=1 Tax=Mollisia scopiformis TaxID=149040 RepID=A0A194XQR1_MOLSC|nr:putative hexose transport-related protein [Mollisia scopiformis]KUJ22394.1 putative hexose transport-related protein [Mollisia scopiformis]
MRLECPSFRPAMSITATSNIAENVISIDALALKQVDEEVQYAIANHQSYLRPRSKEAFTLYFFLVFAFLNATSSGFDGSLMGSINAEATYKNFFHLKETGSSTGLVFVLYNVASMVGCAFGGPIMDYFGRRKGMQSGCLFTLGGAVLASAAQTLPQFKASRFLLGFGIILQTLSAPVYVTEIIPPQWRGRLGGYYNTFYFVGSITATGVVYATSRYTTTLAWRLPLALQVIPPTIVFIGCFFIPESPRWLASRDRMDEAAKIIYRFHGGEDNEVAKLEVREIALHVKLSKPQTPGEYIKGLWDYRELFNSHSARWRTAMITLLTFASQLTGNNILTFFQPTMLAAVGVTSVRRKLLLTFASSIVSCSGAVIGSATNDWIMRRTRFVWGSFSLASALALVAGMSSRVAASTAAGETPSKAISGVGIFAIFLFGWIFSFVYTPNQSLYCTEVLNQEIRAKGISLHALESNLATIFFTYTTSIALGDISWKYYFVWIAVDVVAGFLWFFFGVETVGRTIEELDTCFEARFPPKASWKRTKLVKNENEELGVKLADLEA